MGCPGTGEVKGRDQAETPFRRLADPSAIASLLNVDAARLRDDQRLFSLLFEFLCIHDLSAYAEFMPDAGNGPLFRQPYN